MNDFEELEEALFGEKTKPNKRRQTAKRKRVAAATDIPSYLMAIAPRERRKNKKPEGSIQKKIIQHLNGRNDVAFCIRVNSGKVQTIHNTWIQLAPTGTADLIGMTTNGRFFAIETKAKQNKASEKQERFLTKVAANGGLACVARSVDDVEKMFDSNAS